MKKGKTVPKKPRYCSFCKKPGHRADKCPTIAPPPPQPEPVTLTVGQLVMNAYNAQMKLDDAQREWSAAYKALQAAMKAKL